MDIRIGNDIKLKIVLPEYLKSKNIFKIKAYLYYMPLCKDCCKCCFIPYSPSQYTMPKHLHYSYNELPSNMNCKTCRCCKHCKHNSKHIFNTFEIDYNNNVELQLLLKNTSNYKTGLYFMILDVQTLEEGYGNDDLHSYSIDYGPVFSLSDNITAEEGDIVIVVNKESTQTDQPVATGTVSSEEVGDDVEYLDIEKDILSRVLISEDLN